MTQLPSLQEAERIVIKIGSLMLADADSLKLKKAWLQSMASDIAMLRQAGKEVVIVSSGATTLGRLPLGLTHPNLSLSEKQASAACGQIELVQAWQKALDIHDIKVAQILITAEDTEDRKRYLNARNTLNMLLEIGAVPIINENDTITTKSIRYGDNDRLAACVSGMVGADVLVLLSDIDGMYTADPSIDKNAKLIPVIDSITPEIEAMAGDARDHYSTGGMKTKVMAAKRATIAGSHMVITHGGKNAPVTALMNGANATWFIASDTPISARKGWIASTVNPRGKIIVDDGATRALKRGNSLLPSGIVSVEGNFDHSDTILIQCETGELLGSGITLYSHKDVAKIMGKQSGEIHQLLGYHRGDAVIHRDDMVLEATHSHNEHKN